MAGYGSQEEGRNPIFEPLLKIWLGDSISVFLSSEIGETSMIKP